MTSEGDARTQPVPVGDAVRVIDAHVHLFPPDVLVNRDAYHQRDAWFEQLYRDPKALIRAEHELLESMDASGIAHAIVCGFPWRDPGLCREHTQWLAALCALYPERLSFMGIVSPGAAPHESGQDAETAFALGACAIGELNADAQGFDLTNLAQWAPLMEVAAAAGRPVMLHASEPLGHVYPGKGRSTPDRLLTFLQHFPQQPIVLAHWGGGLPFYELMPEVAAATQHVTYDSAATTYLYRRDIWQVALRLLGPERILFASDYPVLGQQRLLARTRVDVPHEVQAAVLGENAARVYGLPLDDTSTDEPPAEGTGTP